MRMKSLIIEYPAFASLLPNGCDRLVYKCNDAPADVKDLKGDLKLCFDTGILVDTKSLIIKYPANEAFASLLPNGCDRLVYRGNDRKLLQYCLETWLDAAILVVDTSITTTKPKCKESR